MVRKLLIIFAIFVAAFPHLGFTESTDVAVTTSLALFMAAILLFSKRPRTQQPQRDPFQKATPSPFSPSMQELPIAHPDVQPAVPKAVNIASPTPFFTEEPREIPKKPDTAIPSPVVTQMRKRTHASAPLVAPVSREVRKEISPVTSAPVANLSPELPQRRVRKQLPRVILAHEENVQPADIPMHAHSHMHAQTHGHENMNV